MIRVIVSSDDPRCCLVDSSLGILICARAPNGGVTSQFPSLVQREVSVEPAIGWCRLQRIATPCKLLKNCNEIFLNRVQLVL